MTKETTPAAADRYLQFNLGANDYAIPLLQVREVIGNPETTPIPFSPSYFIGLVNLRGQVISVIDLRKKMGVTPAEKESDRAVIILDLEGVIVGCLVDSVNRVLNLQGEQIQPAAEVESVAKLDFLIGVAQVESRLTALVDVYKLLNIKDMSTISGAAATKAAA